MTDKDFDDLKKKVEELERTIDKQRINNLATELSEITGTIDTTYGTDEATVISALMNFCNQLRDNIRGQ